MLKNVGKNFIIGLSASSLSEKERAVLRELRPSGIIIFKHNIEKSGNWASALKDLIAEVKELSEQEQMLIAIDHEGGLVHRLPNPITHFKDARSYARDAEEVGRIMGEELAALGFNLNFAPVLDIHSEESYPIIGRRSFGCCAEDVIAASLAFKKGLERSGVIACAKHFPGHGATTCDSHLELPILDISEELLAQRELAPFRAFIKDGGRMIMSAHILFKVLDQIYPATLSATILNDLLRKKLGFRSCIITDDLEMKALANYSRKEIGTLALNAGVDFLLVANAHDKHIAEHALEMAEGVLENLESALIKQETIALSQNRIDTLLSEIQ